MCKKFFQVVYYFPRKRFPSITNATYDTNCVQKKEGGSFNDVTKDDVLIRSEFQNTHLEQKSYAFLQ